jgi:hypothetical protein
MDYVAHRGTLKVARCPACGLYIGHTTQKFIESNDEAVLTNPNHFNMIIDNYAALTNACKTSTALSCTTW